MRARRLRRALAALLAVAGLFVPFIVGVPTAYDGEPVFVAIPVEHVNTLIGTGTGAAIVGRSTTFPAPRCRSAWCSTRRTPSTTTPATTTTTRIPPDSA